MPQGNTGRKPGRPRKNPVVVANEDPSQNDTVLTTEPRYETQSGESVAELPRLSENSTVLMGKLCFTPAEIERIKSCDEVYLVTKNKERLENGGKDKQVHPCAWLKEVV